MLISWRRCRRLILFVRGVRLGLRCAVRFSVGLSVLVLLIV